MHGVAKLRSRPSALTEADKALLEATVGMDRYRVVARRPLTIAIGPRAYVPGLSSAAIAFVFSYHQGPVASVATAFLAGVALLVSLAVHEAGHLLFGMGARGIQARMLIMRSSGGASIVQGRFADARSAAVFAAGGPVASMLLTVTLIYAALLIPTGPVHDALLVTAFLNVLLLLVNLLPVAPLDGFALFRSAVWAEVGNRAEAERRAITWSRIVLFSGLSMSLLVLLTSHRVAGVAALCVLATLTAQHRAAARHVVPAPVDDAR
jgi:Zn-dependent protease